MYDQILIGVDGSEASERAARAGLELATAFGATVTAAHVVDSSTLSLARDEAETETVKEASEDAFAGVDALAAEVGQEITTELLEGSPANALRDHAAATDADLLVMGRQGASGLGQRLLGSVTERVLSGAERPVFVVPESAQPVSGYERLLVPTDGSENAEAALPHASAVAERYGTSLDVLNVIDVQSAGGAFDAGGLKASFVERLEAEGEDAVDRAAATLRESVPDAEIQTAVERTESESAAAVIAEHAVARESDLLVMGSRGRSTVKQKLLGSVAAGVLGRVDVPVLVAPN